MLTLAAAAIVLACGAPREAGIAATAVTSQQTSELAIYAASSLTDSFTELARAYEQAHPGVRVVLSFDASSALRVRIEEGAPADVFAAADVDNAEQLSRAPLSAGPAVSFARNALAIVVPVDNPAGITRPEDLARAGVRIVAAGPNVPITVYGRQLLVRLSRSPGVARDLAARVEANVVSREDNVRAILAKVALGEADAGIVYRTDALTSERVRAITIPESVNVSATYAAVALNGGCAGETRALEFVRWLRDATAQGILVGSGFGRAP